MRILLTGATGFLGSHIAEALLEQRAELMITQRRSSSVENCISFIDNVQIIYSDVPNWISQACSFCPDIIVHSAWAGVFSTNRDNWNQQLSNVDVMNHLLYIAQKCKVSKFVALGSQAEYGNFNGIISEEENLSPVTYYGYVKTFISRMLSSFCNLHGIDWFWLRVFSVYGERESDKWLIPGLIKSMLTHQDGIDLTPGEQKYAYLYVKDLALAVAKVCFQSGPQGIYNISSSTSIELRKLIEHLRDALSPSFELRFGALPYRLDQSMLIEGDTSKFVKAFGSFEVTSLKVGLERVIHYYKKQYEII